jgi:hypothetical protein
VTKSTELSAAKVRFAAATAQHEADVQALERGRGRLADAQAEIDKLVAEDAHAIERHAARLTQQTREGRDGPLPALVPSDKLLAAQITAQRTLQAAQQMIASLEQAERASRDELAAAEQAVGAAADAVLSAEAEQLLAEVESHLEEAIRLGARLREYQPNALHTPINQQHALHPHIQQALARVEAATRDSVHTPVHLLRTDGIRAPTDFLAKRRAALIAGAADGAPPGPAAVERAA